MSMSLIVADGAVLERNGDSLVVLSAVQVWRKSQAEKSPIELEVLGYGKFQINVALSKNKLFVELAVISEAGKLSLTYFPNDNVDYAIIGKKLIPLEKFEIDALREILLSLGISLEEPIPLGTCYRFLAMALD
jgi:hypothetical protein